MKRSNLLILLCLLIMSCNSNPWKGKKYYVLSCKLNGYVASLQEVELNFINDEFVEFSETLSSSFGSLETYKGQRKDAKLFKYKYSGKGKDAILEIPELNLRFYLLNQGDNNLKTSTNEIMYKRSIVGILNTEEARERVVKANANKALNDMYLRLLTNGKEEEQAEGFEGE